MKLTDTILLILFHRLFFGCLGSSLLPSGLVAVSWGYSSLRCAGFSLQWLLLLRSMGSRRTGSVVVAHGLQSAGSVVVVHGLSCSTACRIFPGQGSNPCPCIGRRILNNCATREVSLSQTVNSFKLNEVRKQTSWSKQIQPKAIRKGTNCLSHATSSGQTIYPE